MFIYEPQQHFCPNIPNILSLQQPLFSNEKLGAVCSKLCLCILIYWLKPIEARGDLMKISTGFSVRNGPVWHASAVINEQVFGSVLSKWSHYWWPRNSLRVARISDDFQAPAGVKGDIVVVWVRKEPSGLRSRVCHSRVKLTYLDWWP